MSRKIMIVEDDLYSQNLFEEAFKEHDFEVTIIPNADHGFVEKVVEFGPDIISMDIMISKQDTGVPKGGFDAIEQLKSDDRTKDIPVIVLSNFTSDDKVDQAVALGAADYIIASAHSPLDVAKRFLIYISDPKNYQPAHPKFKK